MFQDFENLHKSMTSWTPNSEMIKAKVIARMPLPIKI